MMMGYGFGFGMFGFVLNLLVIIGIVYLVIKFVRGEGAGRATDSAPEKILAERFARGEITEEEYLHKIKILRG